MVWTQKELDELRRTVERHVQGFGYPHEDVSPEEGQFWALAVRIADIPVVVTPARARKLLDVGISFEVPADIRRRFASMDVFDRKAAIGRVKTVYLNKGVEYSINEEEEGELQPITLQQHLVPDELTAQALLDTISRIKDAFYVLLVVDELASARRSTDDGPKAVESRSRGQNVNLSPADGSWNFIGIREPAVWEAWERACEEGETPGESLARVLGEAGYMDD